MQRRRKGMETEFKKGQKVEVRSEEQGFEDSWFIATIVRPSKKKEGCSVVEYQSLLDETESKPLREHVYFSNIRPLQPTGNPCLFQPHEEVDAYHSEGWWKGVITKVNEDSSYYIYFRPSKEEIVFKQSDLRPHFEWIDGRWVNASQNKETAVVAQNGGSVQPPSPTWGSHKTNMVNPQTPGGVGDILLGDLQSISRNTCSRVDTESTASETDLPSNPVFSSPSTFKSNDEFSRPFKKVREGEGTKAPMSIKARRARETPIRSPMDVEARCVLSFPSTGRKRMETVNRRARNPDFFDLFSSSLIGKNSKDNGNTSQGKSKDDLACKRFGRKLSYESSSHHPEIVEAKRVVVLGLCTSRIPCKEEQHVGLLSQQDKEPLFGNEGEGLGNQIENAMNRNRTQSKGSGPENDSTSKEMINVQSESTGLPSNTVEKYQTLSMFQEKTESTLVKDNGGTGNEAAKNDLTTDMMDCAQLLSPGAEKHQTLSSCLPTCNPTKGGGPENDSTSKEMTNVQTNCTQFPSNVLEEHQTLSMFHEITDSTLAKDNGGSENETAKNYLTTDMMDYEQLLSPYAEQTSSSCFQTSNPSNAGGPENVSTFKEMTDIQIECTQLQSNVLEENQTLSMFHEKTDSNLVKDNGGTEDEAAKHDLTTDMMDCAQDLSPNIEKHQPFSSCLQTINPSNGGGVEDDETDHQALSPCLESSNCMLEDNGRVHGSFPFTKRSHIWEIVESMEAFKLMPQHPHFRCLETDNEELREGTALGYMLTFANLMEGTCKAQLDDHENTFENKLEALAALEEHGFIVQPLRSRLQEMLEIRASYSQVDAEWKTAEKELIDETGRLDEVQESITRINMQLEALLAEKERENLKVRELERLGDEIKESIQSFRLDFDGVAAAPW